MITQMKKYTFLVFHRDYEPFLTQLRDLGVVHITQKAAGLIEDDEQLQIALQHEDELRRLIKQGAPDTMLAERANILQSIADAHTAAQQAAVWGEFDSVQIEKLKNAGYTLRFYSCATSAYQEEWGVKVAESEGKTYFVLVENTATQNVEIPELLEKATEIPQPEKSAAQWAAEIEHLQAQLTATNSGIEQWQKENIEALQHQLVEARQQIDWQRVHLSTDKLAEGSLCLFEGFCPIDKEADLNAMLASAQVYYEENDPAKEDETPIKLRNNRFTKLFEPLTGMYGWPDYHEFDPTPILGPFFLLFFAICMGDCGYGLLLILLGALIAKGKLRIEMFDGLGPIITVLGVGTAVVGFFLGTFFGIDLYNASWVPDTLKSVMIKGNVMGYDIQMVMALCIGVFHICLAMTIKAISYTLRDGFRATVSTWGWLLLIVGSIATLIITMTFSLPAETTKWTLITIGGISALGIFIFNTPGRNPLINIGAGLWDTYNMATGILGDTLSYIRLYALGLAGGMLGGAFNNLAGMVLGDNPTWQWLPFVLIIVIGHALNLAMSALGAFVHPLRLSFVEYFKNSGYQGSGKLYQPFKK